MHHITSPHSATPHITSHHTTARHITSHHITSHHITTHHIVPREPPQGKGPVRLEPRVRGDRYRRDQKRCRAYIEGLRRWIKAHITSHKVKQHHIKSRSTTCLCYRVDGNTESPQRPRGEHLHGQHSTPHHTTLHRNTSHHIPSQHRTTRSIVHSPKRIKARRITPCHITITSHQTMPHPTTSQRVKVYRVTHHI